MTMTLHFQCVADPIADERDDAGRCGDVQRRGECLQFATLLSPNGEYHAIPNRMEVTRDEAE